MMGRSACPVAFPRHLTTTMRRLLALLYLTTIDEELRLNMG